MSFKVGDKVRYVRTGAFGGFSCDWAEVAGLVLGSAYTVREINSLGSSVKVEEGQNLWVHKDHFELVTDEQPKPAPFKAGDKVRYVRQGAIGWEGDTDWAEMAGLTLGQEYTARAVAAGGDWVILEEDQRTFCLHPDHFELVTDEQPKPEQPAEIELYDGLRVLFVVEDEYRTIRQVGDRWVAEDDRGEVTLAGEPVIRGMLADGSYQVVDLNAPVEKARAEVEAHLACGCVRPGGFIDCDKDWRCKVCGRSFGAAESSSLAFTQIVPAATGLPTDAATRKGIPIYSGFIKYFPDAIAAVAELSRIGNDQHNPGKPLHWDRSKSGDEMDALCRHMVDQAKGVEEDTDGVLHATKLAWRAMAHLQKLIESRR